MKTFVMALNFTNGKYIEVGLDHVGLKEMKKKAFLHLKNGDVMECENICFRCADLVFIAFYEKKAEGSSGISDEKIETEKDS